MQMMSSTMMLDTDSCLSSLSPAALLLLSWLRRVPAMRIPASLAPDKADNAGNEFNKGCCAENGPSNAVDPSGRRSGWILAHPTFLGPFGHNRLLKMKNLGANNR